MTRSSLPFGPIPADAWTLCIDMQRLFLEPGAWYAADGEAILPVVERLVRACPARTLFTRFITAPSAAQAQGCWQRYYRRWGALTQAEAGSAVLELHPQLAPHAYPGHVLDKLGHNAFESPAFRQRLTELAPSALIVCGIETDICVLATVLSAVDLGHRVILASDAIASSDNDAHRACLTHVYPRLDQQVEITSTQAILAAWPVSPHDRTP